MNSNRIGCAFVMLAGIMTGMAAETAIACNPDLGVVLAGPRPEWVHVGCHLPVDATVSGSGWVSSWRYYVYPGGDCSRCYCVDYGPCGDPPISSCPGTKFPSVGEYRLWVDVEEMDEYCNLLDEASDYKTVYAVRVDLTASSTCLCVNGPRVRVDLPVQWAGPTTNAVVNLALSGGGKVWSSQTGGTLLLQGGQSRDWPVGSQPSQVWVEGTAGADCALQIKARDRNGVYHPCTQFPQVHFTVVPGPGCREGQASVALVLNEVPPYRYCSPGDPDRCGYTMPVEPPTGGHIDAVFHNCTWVFDIFVTWDVESGICSTAIDISSGSDPDLTAANYCDIVNSMKNVGGCACIGSQNYTSYECAGIHEAYHMDEFRQNIHDPDYGQEVLLLGELPTIPINCADPSTTTCQAVEAAYMNQLQNDADAAMRAAYNYMRATGESGAIIAARPCFEALAGQICSHAQSQNWPACPACQ